MGFNTLDTNPTKWSNTLKQFVGKSRQIVWEMFDHFVGLAPKVLSLLTRKFDNIFLYHRSDYLH